MDENQVNNEDFDLDLENEDQGDQGGQQNPPVGDQNIDDEKKKLLDENKKLKDIIIRRKQANQQTQTSKPAPINNNNTNSFDRDEVLAISALGSKGLSPDEVTVHLEKARKIAQVEGVNILKAFDTDYYKDFFKKEQEQKRLAAAGIGASKGSGAGSAPKTFQSAGLSDDEFKAMLREKLYGQN